MGSRGYPSYEERTEIVGDYIVFATVEHEQCAVNNPLDDCDGGKIHTSGRNNIGDESDFRRAVGFNPDEGIEYIDTSDYSVQAATLVILALSEQEAREALGECIENGGITPEEVDQQLVAKGETPLESYEEVDVDALPMSVVQATLMFHAHEVARASYKTTAAVIGDEIATLAEKLAKHAIEARAVGDKYAVPLSVRSYNDTTITVEDKSFCAIETGDGVWIPDDGLREEFDAQPYPEAMERARSFAEGDAKMVSDWASGNVFIVDVHAYRLQHDEDGEPIEDFDEYDGEETEYEECLGTYFGDEEAVQAMNEHFGYAKKHVEGLLPSAAESAPAP